MIMFVVAGSVLTVNNKQERWRKAIKASNKNAFLYACGRKVNRALLTASALQKFSFFPSPKAVPRRVRNHSVLTRLRQCKMSSSVAAKAKKISTNRVDNSDLLQLVAVHEQHWQSIMPARCTSARILFAHLHFAFSTVHNIYLPSKARVSCHFLSGTNVISPRIAFVPAWDAHMCESAARTRCAVLYAFRA